VTGVINTRYGAPCTGYGQYEYHKVIGDSQKKGSRHDDTASYYTKANYIINMSAGAKLSRVAVTEFTQKVRHAQDPTEIQRVLPAYMAIGHRCSGTCFVALGWSRRERHPCAWRLADHAC